MNKSIVYSIYFIIFLITLVELPARTIIVDKSGLGEYKSIQSGINAALAGDTIKVYPGVYDEQINIGKAIVLQGSGYEYTQIVSNSSPAVSISNGKIMWFAISSNSGDGIGMTGGIVTNCVIWNCPNYGISWNGTSSGVVQNCNVINTYNTGIRPNKDGLSVINCIILSTQDSGSRIEWSYGITVNILYTRTRTGSSYGIGLTNSDPNFVSDKDFKITSNSSCWDTGKPDIYDPDGSRSDMGYYGGPDAPVFPVVHDLKIYYNNDGTINIEAAASSRY